ncbi:hypothetical protein Tco_0037866 [Tanacetum coccineum]
MKDLFDIFDQYLIDELSEVQNVFHQIEQAVEQHCYESKTFEVKMNHVLNENERLLEQVINKDTVNIILNSTMVNASVNVHECKKCLKLKAELLNKKDSIEKETYDKLDNSVSNQSAPNFDQYFKLNELKAQSQEKDTVIKKLKGIIKSLNGNMNQDKEKDLVITTLKNELRKLKGKDLAYTVVTKRPISPEMLKIDVEPIAPRLDNSVSNQSAPNFDQYFKLNELKAQSQEKDTVIKKLNERIKLLSGNMNEEKVTTDIEEIEMINIELDHRVSKLIAENEHLKQTYKQLYDSIKPTPDNVVTKHTIALEMLKIDVEPIAPRLLNNRTTHSDYLRHTQEQAVILREIVEQGKSQNPLNNSLDSALKPSTSASGSQPSSNTKKDKTQRTPRNANIQHSKLNTISELLFVKCNGCMLSNNHDLCVLDFINDVNARTKSKSVKKGSKRKFWKPTGKVFTNIRYTWRPTGRTFTIVGNVCPLTRITITAEVPLRKPTALESVTPKPVVTLVYSRKPRKSNTNVLVSKPKIIKSISANNKEPSKSWDP